MSDYTATINWGDGTTSTTADGSLTIAAGATGGFEITTTHAFKEEGKFTYTLTISDGGTSTTVSDTADVDDNDLEASGKNIRPVEGQQFAGVVATFTDGDPQGQPADYTSQIDWGDGSQSPGTVVYNGSASLTVDPRDPNFNLAYTIGNDGGVPSLFSVVVSSGKSAPLFKLDDTFTGGLALDTQTSQLYAISNDAGGFSTLDIIGTAPGQGIVVPAAQTPGIPQFALGSGFTGGLAFDSMDGSFYTIANDANGNSQLEHIILPTASSPAQISSVFSLGSGFTGGLTFDSTDGMLYAVASDANGSSSFYRIDPVAQNVTSLFSLKQGFSGGLAFDALDGNFYAIRGSATGDATFFGFPITGLTPSQESDITGDFTDGFDVLASHTFADESTQKVSVAIADLGGSQITALGSATVVDFSPKTVGTPPKLSAFQGITTGPVNLASFTVPGGLETGPGEYTASIDWGDGTPAGPGTVTIANSTLSDTATVTGNEIDTNQANNTATATTVAPGTPTGPVDLAVTNVISSAVGTVGANLTYTITVTNGSATTSASGVVMTDALPATTSATFVSATDANGGTISHSGNTLSDTIGALAQGASDTITVVVTPTAVGVISDTATVEGNESDTSQSDNTSTVTTPVEGNAPALVDLSVTNAGAPATGTVGANLTYTITVTNGSATTSATGVVMTDALPATTNATFVSAKDGLDGTITLSGSTLSDPIGALAAGASDTITIVVKPTAAAVGAISDTSTVEGNETDVSQNDNTATVTTPVEGNLPGPVDLSVAITGAPASVALGEPETYTITVGNAAIGKATGVVLSDALPADATFVSAVDAGGGTITHSGNTLTDAIGAMAPDAGDTITVVVRPTAAGTISDKASVEGDETDVN